MSNLGQIPTDYKKFLDMFLHKYQAKENPVRSLFKNTNIDSADTTPEYVRLLQDYSAAKGFTSFDDPDLLADGARPQADSMGTEDATSTIKSYAKAYRLDRKLLKSSKSTIQSFIAEHALQKVQIIENQINRNLLTNMASNAGQTYTATGGTWSTTGDPVSDIIEAKQAFYDAAGGQAADFLLLNPNELGDIEKDNRFQSTDYVSTKQMETGTITPNPLGLKVVRDPAVTTGTFFMGVSGRFGEMMISENFDTTESDEGLAGKVHEIVFSYIDQYKLPRYLMYGTGI